MHGRGSRCRGTLLAYSKARWSMRPVWFVVIGLTGGGCSSTSSNNNDGFAPGGVADQAATGGSATTGGTLASTTGPAAAGGTPATGGSRAVPQTGGTSAVPGYPFSRCIYTCYCGAGKSSVVDLACPATTDPTSNLCVRDLSLADAGITGVCSDDCTSYCKSQGTTCANISTLSCTK
jgi:hypothetical protein